VLSVLELSDAWWVAARSSRPCAVTYADRVTDRSKSTREQLEAQVREYFPREVETCEQFLELAVNMIEVDPWRGRPVKGSADRIVAAEAARGLKTYRGSLDAALGGYAPQAAMLNRALFEATVVCWWTCKNPELAPSTNLKGARQRLAWPLGTSADLCPNHPIWARIKADFRLSRTTAHAENPCSEARFKVNTDILPTKSHPGGRGFESP